MSLTDALAENVEGYSKAKYSTWIYYRPDRLLLDAGEGVATSLGNYVYGVEQIFISHGHYDHIGGIPGILRSRLSSRGDKEKPLDIYYPAGSTAVVELQRYVERSIALGAMRVQWLPLEEGAAVPLRTGGARRAILSFRSRHTRQELTLGFTLLESRRRRRAEFRHLDEEEMRALARQGDVEVMEPYQKRLVTYSGDSMPLCPEDVEGAQLLIHDATFLRRKDRDRPTHATLDEAAELARDGGCAGLVACHVSARYSVKDVRRALERLRDRGDLEIPVWFLEFKGGLRRDLHRGLPSDQDQGLGAGGSGC